MSIPGCDYSFDKPTPAELKAAGMKFVVRYVGTPSSGKNLTLAEATALQNAGLDIVSNYEAGQAGWMQGGYSVGKDAARAAHDNAVYLGMPADRPIYFSCDFNATYDQYKNGVKPCLQGAASVLGKSRVGIYGGIEQVDWAYSDGVAVWVWQTYAWSYGQWSKHARIQQYKNGQTLGSGTVDYDRALVADFGQWATIKETFMALSDSEEQEILKAARQINGAVAAGQPDFSETIEATLGAVQSLTNIVKSGQGSLAAGIGDVRSAILGAVAALPAPETPEQAQQATQQILDALQGLGVEGLSAAAVLDAMAARLAA
jgi:Domain of unknown function (DUF1906)